eukprot:SAG11_NODE_13632_length_646_cov_0.745887_1_plen_45_part_00
MMAGRESHSGAVVQWCSGAVMAGLRVALGDELLVSEEPLYHIVH